MDRVHIFRTERTLPFTPPAIYDAFASAPLLAAWWGPDGFTNSFEAFDFKVGGRWVFVMHGPDGSSYPNQNVFTELEPARRVVIRHDCPPHFTLTVQLSAVAGGTHLTWEQAFDDAVTARAVKAIVVPANEQNLDRLTRALSASANLS
ncbi:MAG: polyketide cyclase [Burkholderiales bacterium PBB1]|nr:MAG: polyketide cyclase [Burkholderiales bacterium PBB1]